MEQIEQNTQRPGVIRAYIILWKFMSKKDKACFIFILLSTFVTAFVQIFPSQAIALLISKLSNETVYLFGMGFLNAWGTVETIFFLVGLTSFLWLIGMANYLMIDLFARRMICVVNEKAMEIIFEPRKNLDFGLTNGEVNYIIKSASDNVYELIENLCWQVLTGIVASIMIGIQILLIDWVTFIVFIGVIVVICAWIFLRVKIQNPIVERIEQKNAKIGNTILKSIFNLPMITILKSQLTEISYLKKENAAFYKEHKKRAWIGFYYWIFVIALEYFGLGLVVYVALTRMAVASITVPQIILMITYINYCYGPIENFGFLLSSIQGFAVKVCNLFKLKVWNPNVRQLNLIQKDAIDGVEIHKITIKNMVVQANSFRQLYNADFYCGNMTTIKGKSGTGKTTMSNAMCGLREYQKGEIILNDQYKIKSFANSLDTISYTFQDAMLFDRSIRDNIYYPNLKESKESNRIIKTLGLEGLLDRDMTNSNILTNLSGGEKKRISLVKGMIKPAQIYIFDEPTNDLDKKSVSAVLKEIKRLSKKHIVIIISHDARVLEESDVVIDLDT